MRLPDVVLEVERLLILFCFPCYVILLKLKREISDRSG